MDAARLLPLFGIVLIALPALWRPSAEGVPEAARGLIYLFSVWAVLVGLAAALARGLAPAIDAEEEAEGSLPDLAPDPLAAGARTARPPPKER